jgi:hypothetical protein
MGGNGTDKASSLLGIQYGCKYTQSRNGNDLSTAAATDV